MTDFNNNQKKNQSYKKDNKSFNNSEKKSNNNSNKTIVKENKNYNNNKENEYQKTYNQKNESRNNVNSKKDTVMKSTNNNSSDNSAKTRSDFTNNKNTSNNNAKQNQKTNNNAKVNDKTKTNYQGQNRNNQSKFDKTKNTSKKEIINKSNDVKENINPIEITDKILKKNKKAINLTLLAICGVMSLNVINNLAYSGSDLDKIKKDNQTLESNISKMSGENKSLEKEIESITSKNEKLQEKLDNLLEKNFKAVPGTLWTGNIKLYGQEEDNSIALEIKNEEIILNANAYPWNRLEVEENEEKIFNARVALSSGDINKETGYFKLNRLSLKNPPQGLQEYEHEVLPYNYDIIFNKDYATGFVLDGNNIKGTIHLQLTQ